MEEGNKKEKSDRGRKGRTTETEKERKGEGERGGKGKGRGQADRTTASRESTQDGRRGEKEGKRGSQHKEEEEKEGREETGKRDKQKSIRCTCRHIQTTKKDNAQRTPPNRPLRGPITPCWLPSPFDCKKVPSRAATEIWLC